jgi:DNA polymerase elongation subunit (family B)
MDVGNYIDFDENQKHQNTIWTFVDRGDGIAKIQQEVLEWAVQGDSDSVWLKYPEVVTSNFDFDNLVEGADALCDNVNSEYPKFLEMVFNTPKARLKEIQSTREVVCDSILILTKKRYIARVADEEGKRYNPFKMKIMGVEIKKANTSTMTKKFLVELVDLILDGRSRDDVIQRIKEMEQEFKSANIKDVATTMNAKKVKSATETFELTGKMKGVHYASKAAVVYNNLCGTSDKKVMPGDKICLVYVNHQMGAIGFPAEINTLPEWLLEIPLDYDKMWANAKQTMTNYLKALGWDIESQKEALSEELFGLTKVKKKGKRN